MCSTAADVPAPATAAPWFSAMLDVATPCELVQAAVHALEALPGCRAARLLGALDGGEQPSPGLVAGAGDAPGGDTDLALARDCLARRIPRVSDGAPPTLAVPLPRSGAAVLLETAGRDAVPALLAQAADPLKLADRQLAGMLEASRLQARLARLERSERVQRALFEISDLAASGRDERELLKGIHAIVGTLMYAENFFIVRLDNDSGRIRFLYYADVEDEAPTGLMTLDELDGSLTGYLLRDGRPLRGDSAQLSAQVSGPLRRVGTDSCDWLGVPMLRDGMVEGALVVQSYQAGVVYSDEDQALLEFVGSHILTALERQHRQEDLERSVRQRTRELADTNLDLQRQVLERERAERLQAALFQIAQLATSDLEEDAFYTCVHEVIGGLLNARNFFVALLTEDRQRLAFPYYVDDWDRHPHTRPLRRGLSEYVLRNARPLLGDHAQLMALVAQGEVDYAPDSQPSLSWLGIPLMSGDEAVGLVAVQSYDASVAYGPADQELLGFVASQVANSLHRRRAAKIQHDALLLLEERVQARTQALRREIAERERAEARLKHQVMHDALTGLPNRGFLRSRLNEVLARLAGDPNHCCALLYLDVDGFKVINDSLGHLAGDEILKQVSTRLKACVREPDLVARLSGDEFVILLECIDSPDAATAVARRVLELLREPVRVDGKVLDTSASIGVAVADGRYALADDLIRDADTALYRAKSMGRKTYAVYEASMRRETDDVLWLDDGVGAVPEPQPAA